MVGASIVVSFSRRYPMSTKIEETLKDRILHYDTQAGQAWELAGQVLQFMEHLGMLDRILATSLSFAWIIILVKLIRILQDPNHVDSWLDIGGYSKLVYDKLTKDKEQAE
jgi:exonuclease V gamma subunit